ncbi:hypothetical protein NQ317_000281 [Molorchus minor]|uniref:FHA domain-containing protein n=1 Tax=Molorchus minor TaxID=1323400 RepID=A0ABQ9JCJ3_9CUCU|nr:hypothetical protein NQ317_000281 [Molorchus minor]
MVVVSGSWVKNVATYPPPTVNSDIVIPNENEMAVPAAKAILICRPNSHIFQERTLSLDQPVKVGRSVGRVKPSSTNAIFDCKVLSRHHALLWYENGKFFLQDTKSSNGTFVNNNKLAPESENHELSSGDIVQFGVDVVENNKKVTHGCIIATIKLFLPDGKVAKASPSITDSDRHVKGSNALETKLTALQNVVDETRKSAEESWQAYVGEERLLSRVSALENQLQQANKNWGEDRLREELAKLQDSNEGYQIAAKEELEKLHAERLQAVSLAMEQERARITAEQEAILAKEQCAQAQLELEEVAQKLTEQQKRIEEQRIQQQQHEHELETRLEAEYSKVLELELKLHELKMLSNQDFRSMDDSVKHNLIYNDDLKSKEEMLAENENCDLDLNKSNGIDNHINLMVRPVLDTSENEIESDESSELCEQLESDNAYKNNTHEETKKVTFKLPEESDTKEADNNESQNESENDKDDVEKSNYNSDHVDSKTLKYQFQSAQNELKRKIELLESVASANKLKISELDRALTEEKEIAQQRLEENETLKQEFVLLQQKWKESCNENQQYKDKISHLGNELELAQKQLKEALENTKENHVGKSRDKTTISNNVVTYDQLVNVEEELVLLKERFAQTGEEKLKLQRDLLAMTDKYNMVCNRSYNKYFFYVAPLVFMVLYLLVSAMIS